ncbi:Hypothetical protein ERS007726_03744 [Mycobacterium tuberculosis]|nr:Hypothetical protein ERS007726_03744 [Mycobacterium tuberculosis]
MQVLRQVDGSAHRLILTSLHRATRKATEMAINVCPVTTSSPISASSTAPATR